MREQSIFIEALEKEDPVERAAFLDQACAADPALRDKQAAAWKEWWGKEGAGQKP